MRFEFIRCATIPKLAWCAEVRRRSDVVAVYHGPWVETSDQWFVEGAWTGPFARGEIDEALFNVGTGGVLRAGRAVFCTPTDPVDRLYSLHVGERLFVSNSLAFVMAMAGDEPDPSYPFYERRMNRYRRLGISTTRKAFRSRLGRQVHLHEYCQLSVGNDLRIVRIEKPVFPRLATYGEYLSRLTEMMGSVLDNAASLERRHQRYEGLATVSGGYDSNALATVASRLGVRQAITLCDRSSGWDSGEAVARHLGMSVTVYELAAFRTTPNVDEAEFFAWPDQVSGISFAPCEPQLAGKVVIMGLWGGRLFTLEPYAKYRDFRRSPAGAGRMGEFRLRVGFLNFHPLYAGGLALAAMRAISSSPEMAPWRVGGDYDRPIARRVLEESGVPRGTFGWEKAGTPSYRFRSTADMSPAGRADLESYLRTMPRPVSLRHGWYQLLATCRSAGKSVTAIAGALGWRRGRALIDSQSDARRHPGWHTSPVAPAGSSVSLTPAATRHRGWDELHFAMHWGQARVRPRYAEAVQRSSSSAHARASSPVGKV